MKRVLILALFLLLTPFAARAQTAQGYLTASGSDCTTPGACVLMVLPSQAATLTFDVSGTFSETIQFEIQQNSNSSFRAVNGFPPNSSTGASSTTSGGTWTVSVAGMYAFRVRCSAFTSGSALANFNTSQSISTAVLGGGSTGGGVSAVTASSPIVSSGGTTPAISCPTCSTGGVTSFTGDGALLTNSASTGAVTATVGNAAAHSYWGNNTGTTAAGAFSLLSAGDMPTAIPIANVGSAGLSGANGITIATTGVVSQTAVSGGAAVWIAPIGASTTTAFSPTSANHVVQYTMDVSKTITFTTICLGVGTNDASNLYGWGVTSLSGTLLAHVAPVAITATSNTLQCGTIAETSVTLSPGIYAFVTTGNATTATHLSTSSTTICPWTGISTTTTTGGTLVNITMPTATPTVNVCFPATWVLLK